MSALKSVMRDKTMIVDIIRSFLAFYFQILWSLKFFLLFILFVCCSVKFVLSFDVLLQNECSPVMKIFALMILFVCQFMLRLRTIHERSLLFSYLSFPFFFNFISSIIFQKQFWRCTIKFVCVFIFYIKIKRSVLELVSYRLLIVALHQVYIHVFELFLFSKRLSSYFCLNCMCVSSTFLLFVDFFPALYLFFYLIGKQLPLHYSVRFLFYFKNK